MRWNKELKNNYVLSVTETNKYLKELISRDMILSKLWVKGEISNYKYHHSGHMYFTLKDENSIIKCVMFKGNASVLRFVPENGMKVIIRGYISVFERDGQYQLYAEEMQPDGLGSLHLAFEQLKKKLEEEGLFDTKYKKSIPYLPRAIGVVTSSTGSVIRDIINVTGRRYPNVELKIFPVAVQGELAARQVAEAIKRLNEFKLVDVIIIARGGGSLEELWAFNEERVARSIFVSEIPIISAVGHETDFTIADFVADLRAPTPSAAAEIVVPELSVLKDKIFDLKVRLKNALKNKLIMKRSRLTETMASIVFRQPYDLVYQERMKLDILNKEMYRAIIKRKDKACSDLGMLTMKLNALSPLAILARGYGIVKLLETERVLKSTAGIKSGDKIKVFLSDGNMNCTVDEIEKS